MRAPRALWLLLPACAATVDIAVQLEWAYADTNDSRKLFWATVALCALPVVVLARRRWPIATFLTTLPGMYLDSCIPSMIALYTVALMTTRRQAVTVCTVVFLLWSGYTLNPEEATWDNPTDYFILMDAFAQAILPVALGLLVSSRAELTARVADLAAARSREDALSAERLLVAERTRLAREMHDVVAHQVSLISVEAAALQMTTSDPAVRDSACAVRTMAARTLDELRQVVGSCGTTATALTPVRPSPGSPTFRSSSASASSRSRRGSTRASFSLPPAPRAGGRPWSSTRCTARSRKL
ncbi:histidine kinase [Streptomyces sp. NPDC058619]|uniref:histidine kinase n=1 Tax=unclassified Streptomyces TaxID=2593676 RepID=UPI0036523A04